MRACSNVPRNKCESRLVRKDSACLSPDQVEWPMRLALVVGYLAIISITDCSTTRDLSKANNNYVGI